MIADWLASKWLNWRTHKWAQKSPEWNELNREFEVHKVEMHQGGMEAIMMHPAISYLAEEAGQLLNDAGAENYLQFDLMPRIDRGTKPIRITVQWAAGLSPASKNAILLKENERLRTALAFYADHESDDGATAREALEARR